jgi:hypothetical protein
MSLKLINANEYNPYYKNYIEKSTDTDIVNGLEHNLEAMVAFYSSIPIEKHDYAYADGKWTVKDVLLHIIDTERIFAYRALRFARKDKTPLMGFEQDDYVINVNTKNRTLENILQEFKIVRQGSIALFKTFDDATLKQIGEASNSPFSVRALGYIITGHENHHNQIIRERYL